MGTKGGGGHSPGALWVKVHSIDGTKVTLDTANLLLKDLVNEPDLELAGFGGGGRDIPRLLTSSTDDVVPGRGNGGRVEGPVVLVELELTEVDVEELGRHVLGGGDKVGPLLGELQVHDGALVALVRLHPLAQLPVPDAELTVLVPAVDVLVEGSPRRRGHLGISNVHHRDRLRVLWRRKG